MDEREKNLPRWAQEIIINLRKRVEAQAEPLVRELATLRPRVDLLTRRNEALTELLECAALGNHKTAQEIVNIIGQYSLELIPNNE